MAKVGTFINKAEHTYGSSVLVNTGFTNPGSLAMQLANGKLAFRGHLEGVWLYFDTLNSSPTKITMRLTSDSAGDECIVTDTDATLAVGVGTATDGSAVYKVDLDWARNAVTPTGDTVYPWMKTDAGTAKINRIVITWRE
tara:strand:- start:115 stop:534 length:420 start_codon:yes stop_codon:yes gene_type:complete